MTSATATGVPGVSTADAGSLTQLGITVAVRLLQRTLNASAFTLTAPSGSPESVPVVARPGMRGRVRIAAAEPDESVTVIRRQLASAGPEEIARLMTPRSSRVPAWHATIVRAPRNKNADRKIELCMVLSSRPTRRSKVCA